MVRLFKWYRRWKDRWCIKYTIDKISVPKYYYCKVFDGNSKVIYYYVINKKYEGVSVAYKTQIQSSSWEKSYVKNGQTSGTIGKRKRLEAIKICFDNKFDFKSYFYGNYAKGLNYRTHIQKYDWQKFVTDNELSGTVGKSLRLEAIQIQLVYKDTPAPGTITGTFKSK